jgi:hypothetical protein
MSTAERQADDISPPKRGFIINFVVAPASTETVDLEDPALNPAGVTQPDYWRGRYVTIKVETNDCQFALSEDIGDVLTPGAAAPAAPALDVDRGVIISAGSAPETRFFGPGSTWRFLQFASVLGCTVTIWPSSPQ